MEGSHCFDAYVVGKELRLKQQYFWTAASLADIMRRFKDLGKPITEFPQCTSCFPFLFCMSLSRADNGCSLPLRCFDPAERRKDPETKVGLKLTLFCAIYQTHPTLAIPELMRILVDEEEVPWATAWQIVSRTFAYTNHTVLPEVKSSIDITLERSF